MTQTNFCDIIKFVELNERIRILTEGAKYDVSCSSSGSDRGSKAGALGNAAVCGICHSFTSDGRCISIMKLLMTNNCVYDCQYCQSRRSSDIPRASLTPDEICSLVINFYKRNYIEGLFLSSAVEYSPNRTMEALTDTVIKLRNTYGFNGYIHLKGIPNADNALIKRAARYVDRMSMNIELPSESSLKLLAPQKTKESIVSPMRMLARNYLEEKENRAPKTMIPAGQTTQMIIGATPDTDGTIMRLTQNLYRMFGLKRVYYSAYVPVGNPKLLPALPADMLREHRLYQADWLLRFYGFDIEELVPADSNLPSDIDPKCAWALCNIDRFPVEINTAPHETLLRVPGIGVRSAWRIVQARKHAKLDFDDLKRMRVVLKRAVHFITCGGKYYGLGQNPQTIRPALALPVSEQYGAKQLNMFVPTTPEIAQSALVGEL